MVTSTTIEREVRGRYALAESVGFGFGHREASREPVMRLAFCADGYRGHAGVAVTESRPGLLRFEVTGPADPEAAVVQAARVLGVDVDATGYDSLVDADPLLGEVVARRPGLRPVSFSSAYEALLWAVLSARRPARQMAAVREALATAHGHVVDVAGQPIATVPGPDELLAVASFDQIPDVKLQRLHVIAEAARAGELDTATLRAGDPDEVGARLRELPGIGPFYSELVTVRALGHTDVPPTTEPRGVAAVGRLVGRDDFGPADFAEVVERWRPWRTWASVAVRASTGG